ncbi:MAG: energy transducer TonB, partial [Bacteroidota bacterium]
EFVIEKHTAEELILRTNLNGQLPETRHYFLSKEKFSTFSKEEIKKQYSFTPTDSLNLAARIAEKAALEELRKSDRKAIWPGGNPAFKAYMKVHLTYPEGHARYMLVRVHFDVELDGSTSNIEIRLQKEDSYTEAAVQFVEGMTDWLPAIKDGQPQKSTTYIDIHFRYPRE